MKLGPEVAGKAPEKKALSHTSHLGKVVRRRGTEKKRGRVREGSQPAETQVASRSVGQKLEGDLCMREKGRGHGGGGFDNELDTNFISMQACCLSL